MRKRGEITVFLTMILVCVWALLCGLVESARTAGARATSARRWTPPWTHCLASITGSCGRATACWDWNMGRRAT